MRVHAISLVSRYDPRLRRLRSAFHESTSVINVCTVLDCVWGTNTGGSAHQKGRFKVVGKFHISTRGKICISSDSYVIDYKTAYR